MSTGTSLELVRPFLELTVQRGGSDLHLAAGEPPRIRVNGHLHRVKFRALKAPEMRVIAEQLMQTTLLSEQFAERKTVDLGFTLDDLGHFRANVSHHLEGIACAFRVIPRKIRSLESLNLPAGVTQMLSQPRGLTLVTGPTGSGKSTTLAAMIDHINSRRMGRIITIEDPVEYVHGNRHCIVTQREVGAHSESFANALRDALREDPDVVMVGEMRDVETIGLALTAAETGIQVLASLHTTGAVRTVDRIVNVFPAGRQSQVRTMLSESLSMVVSQHLIPGSDGASMHMAAEVLVNANAAGSLIRSGKTNQLTSLMRSGGKLGMQLMDEEIEKLFDAGKISGEEAYRHAIDKSQFESFATRVQLA